MLASSTVNEDDPPVEWDNGLADVRFFCSFAFSVRDGGQKVKKILLTISKLVRQPLCKAAMAIVHSVKQVITAVVEVIETLVSQLIAVGPQSLAELACNSPLQVGWLQF